MRRPQHDMRPGLGVGMDLAALDDANRAHALSMARVMSRRAADVLRVGRGALKRLRVFGSDGADRDVGEASDGGQQDERGCLD